MTFGKIPEHVTVEIEQYGASVKFSSKYKEAFLQFAENVADRLAMNNLGAIRRTQLNLIPEPLNVEGEFGVPQAITLFLYHHEDLALAGSREPKTLTVFESWKLLSVPDGDATMPPRKEYTYHFTLALIGL